MIFSFICDIVFNVFTLCLQRLHEDTTLFGINRNVLRNFNKIKDFDADVFKKNF